MTILLMLHEAYNAEALNPSFLVQFSNTLLYTARDLSNVFSLKCGFHFFFQNTNVIILLSCYKFHVFLFHEFGKEDGHHCENVRGFSTR